jgi:hypothetical protein
MHILILSVEKGYRIFAVFAVFRFHFFYVRVLIKAEKCFLLF